MNTVLFIGAGVVAYAAFAIGIAKWLERGTSMFEAPEPDAYLRKAYQRAER